VPPTASLMWKLIAADNVSNSRRAAVCDPRCLAKSRWSRR